MCEQMTIYVNRLFKISFCLFIKFLHHVSIMVIYKANTKANIHKIYIIIL